MIPPVDPVSGLLPVGIHQADLGEVYDVFVADAPFEEDRRLLFSAMSVYLDIVWKRFKKPRILLNGGFVTHKEWAAPKDADFAIGLENGEFKAMMSTPNLGLLTLIDVSIQRPISIGLRTLQPMAGLVDSYAFPKNLKNQVDYWENHWGKVTDSDKKEIPGLRKGYLEVIA